MTTYSRQAILDLQASCACLTARSKARTLTREYDAALAPSGLKITQFSLVSLLLAGPFTISRLAEDVDLNRTTLTRNLIPLQKAELITIMGGKDSRQRVVALTAKGKKKTEYALRLWKKAQAAHEP